jgi:hypothetical protein
MIGIVLWALATGIVTGGVWAGIVLYQRQNRLGRRHQDMLEDLRYREDRLREVHERLGELEERLDFAERGLIEKGTPAPGSGAIPGPP